jgi:hypothetical protein
MNRMESFGNGAAQLLYGDAEYTIMRPGSFVLCAVTGARIDLEDLRYWSAERQEAYVDANASLARWKSVNP